MRLLLCGMAFVVCVGCGRGDNPPTLRLYGPYDREACLIGDASAVGYQASETGPDIRIELYRNGLGGTSELIGVFPATDNTQPWTPTGPVSENCVLKATDTSDAAVTAVSSVFRIVGPGLYAIGPHLSWPVAVGETVLAEWHGPAAIQASITAVRLELSRDGGTTWEELAASMPLVGDRTYSWTATDGGQALPQTACQFRVSEVGNATTYDTSLSFSIE